MESLISLNLLIKNLMVLLMLEAIKLFSRSSFSDLTKNRKKF